MFRFIRRSIRSYFDQRKPAGIEYVGHAGCTHPCLEAIVRYIHFGDVIPSAYLITHGSDHAFILKNTVDNWIAVKAGFASGYRGTGPHGLAMALILLERHGTDIEELLVDELILHRLDSSSLTNRDVQRIQNTRPVRPTRWRDYIFDLDPHFYDDTNRIRSEYPATIPFALIDDRILDLALDFPDDEDKAVISAYRRLEDIVRRRIGDPHAHGSKLFYKAFSGEPAPLFWEEIDAGEREGRVNLFRGAWMAFRNRRAHREDRDNDHQTLREFLIVNQLYKFEAEAKVRDGVELISPDFAEKLIMSNRYYNRVLRNT